MTDNEEDQESPISSRVKDDVTNISCENLKHFWTESEDKKLIELVEQYKKSSGMKHCWGEIEKSLPGYP